jgi:hypothetical protein
VRMTGGGVPCTLGKCGEVRLRVRLMTGGPWRPLDSWQNRAPYVLWTSTLLSYRVVKIQLSITSFVVYPSRIEPSG